MSQIQGRIVGATISEIREMNETEMNAEYWDQPAMVVVLSTGIKLYASRDEEGNGPGALFGFDHDGGFHVLPS